MSDVHSKTVTRMGGTFAATLLSIAINILNQFVLAFFLIRSWGPSIYGEWVSLTCLVSYLVLLDIGIFRIASNHLQKLYLDGDYAQFSRTLSSCLTFAAMLSVSGILMIAGLAFASRPDQIFHITSLSHLETCIVLVLVSGQFLLGIPNDLLGNSYRALDKQAFSVMAFNAQRLFFIAITAFAAINGASFITLASLQLIPMLLSILLLGTSLGRFDHRIKLRLHAPNITEIKSFAIPGGMMFAVQASGAIAYQGSTTIAGLLLAPASVALFATMRILAGFPRYFAANALTNVVWPEITRLKALDRLESISLSHQWSTKAVLISGTSLLCIIYTLGNQMYAVWTQQALQLDRQVFLFMLGTTFVQISYASSTTIMMATNQVGALMWVSIAQTTICLLAGYYLTLQYGLSGLALGILISEVVTAAWMIPSIACMQISSDIRAHVLTIYGRGAVTTISTAATFYVVRLIYPESMPYGKLIELSITPIFLIYSYLFWLTPTEREAVRRPLMRLTNRTYSF